MWLIFQPDGDHCGLLDRCHQRGSGHTQPYCFRTFDDRQCQEGNLFLFAHSTEPVLLSCRFAGNYAVTLQTLTELCPLADMIPSGVFSFFFVLTGHGGRDWLIGWFKI